MPRLSIGLGLALIIVGVCGYVYVSFASVTALIPAFIGIVFVVLGWIATRPAARKHAMHAASAVALLGVLGSISGVIELIRWMAGTIEPARPAKTISLAVSCVLMLIFLILAIRSFIVARLSPSQA